MPRAPAVIAPAVTRHTATLIFAHGLGDSGAGWMDLATNWRQRGKFEHVKFVFPNAPNIPISANFGMSMPGWYDIRGFDDLAEASQDEAGVLESVETLNGFIASEVESGISSNRIVVGGFSQGGAVSLVTGLTTKHRLGGIVGMSTYLPIANRIPELIAAAQHTPHKDTPVHLFHGTADPLVKYQWGERTRDGIRDLGYKVEWKDYAGMQHSACPEEIGDLEKWLEARLPVAAPEGSGGAEAGSSKV